MKKIVLALLCLLVYYPVFSHGYLLKWDDKWQVLSEYTLNGMTWENLKAIFQDFYMRQYSPLNQLFYTLTHELFGLSPSVFHGINLGWHIVNVLLVYSLVKRLLKLAGCMDTGRVDIVSWCTAALMAVHPLQVEVVSWLSASKVITCACFFLLGLWVYTYYVERKTLLCFLGTLACFVCSFLCKEQGIVFPLVLLLIDYLAKRDWKDKEMWIEKLPFFFVMLVMALVTFLSYEIPMR